jgi:hypothetical protein
VSDALTQQQVQDVATCGHPWSCQYEKEYGFADGKEVSVDIAGDCFPPGSRRTGVGLWPPTKKPISANDVQQAPADQPGIASLPTVVRDDVSYSLSGVA